MSDYIIDGGNNIMGITGGGQFGQVEAQDGAFDMQQASGSSPPFYFVLQPATGSFEEVETAHQELQVTGIDYESMFNTPPPSMLSHDAAMGSEREEVVFPLDTTVNNTAPPITMTEEQPQTGTGRGNRRKKQSLKMHEMNPNAPGTPLDMKKRIIGAKGARNNRVVKKKKEQDLIEQNKTLQEKLNNAHTLIDVLSTEKNALQRENNNLVTKNETLNYKIDQVRKAIS